MRPDLSQVLVERDPLGALLPDDVLSIEPELVFDVDSDWVRVRPEHDAAGRAVRFVFLGHYRVRSCDTGAPACERIVHLGFELTR